MPPMTELPDWPPGTVAILATGGGRPHAIPVSTADHGQPTFEIEAGVRRRWTDPDAERRDAGVRAALLELVD
jgi:hypothetical protein